MPGHTDQYSNYINSLEWKLRRNEFLRTAGHKCQRCGNEANLQVHHLHYNSLGHEKYEDIEVVCVKCHPDADKDRRINVWRERWNRRFEGWAEKRYGEYWTDYPTEALEDEFDAFIEQQGDD